VKRKHLNGPKIEQGIQGVKLGNELSEALVQGLKTNLPLSCGGACNSCDLDIILFRQLENPHV
jgi:hypothetical protein